MKLDRKLVLSKSGGVCWYCGCDLKGLKWHIDHFIPQHRYFIEGGDSDVNGIDNLVPSCAPCNLFKSTFLIEELRSQISYQVERARNTSVNFRIAERFGLLKVTFKPVVFWFEQRSN